jgi:hypothetical protein
VLSIPLIMAAAACHCDVQTLNVANGVILVTPPGPASQFTRSIDFGVVRLSVLQTYTIKLHNNSRQQATIHTQLKQPGNNFALVLPAGDDMQATIPGDNDFSMQLRYLPTAVETDTATVIITTSASSTPMYTINVTGKGAASKIDVCSTDDSGNPICASTSPNYKLVVNMGSVTPGMTSTKPLYVKDLGNATLNVTSIAPTANTTTEFTLGPDHGPATVAVNMQASYTVTYAPVTGGPETGIIAVASDDPNNPNLLVYLNGIGLAPHLCVMPDPVQFGPTPLGSTATQVLTLTSCGAMPVTVQTLAVADVMTNHGSTPVFGWDMMPTFPQTLAPTDSVQLNLTYTPYALGSVDTGQVNLTTDAPGQSHGFVPLNGQGVGCSLVAQPPAVNFGMVPANTMAAATQTVVVTNDGTSDCMITSITTTGAPYGVTNAPTSTVTLAPGQPQVIDVTFAPTAVGPAPTGQLIVASNSQGGALKVPLMGTGEQAPACYFVASPASITFTGVGSGQSATMATKITNLGTDTCDIVGTTVVDPAGSNAPVADFTLNLAGSVITGPVGLAPVMLMTGQNVELQVTFKPSTTAQENVNVQVSYCDDSSPTCPLQSTLGMILGTSGDQTLIVPVTGGTVPPQVCVTPASLDFGSVAAGTTKQLPLTISSCGPAGSILLLRGLRFDSGSSPRFSITSTVSVPEYLPAGKSTMVNVQYAPTNTNGDYGEIAVLSNDPTKPKVEVPVKGNAASTCSTQLVCNPTKLIFPTEEIGRTASLSDVCLNVGTMPVTITGVSFSTQTSAAFTAGVGTPPITVQPGGSTRVIVNYTPTQAGTDTGTLMVNSNSCAPATVSLQGSGKVADYPPCLPPQQFSPQTKWYWTGGSAGDGAANVAMSPIVANLFDSNGDGQINVNDIPDVVFTACTTSQCCVNCLNPSAFDMTDFSGIGSMHAVHGDNGAKLFDVTASNLQLTAVAQLATADLDGDNVPEIVAVQHTFHQGSGMSGLSGKYISGVLLVFDHAGNLEFQTEEWTGDPNNNEFGSAPAIADLDGDGKPEIVFERTVFHYDGTKWYDMAASGAWGHGSFPTIMDVNGDGKPDIVSGAYVYTGATGDLLWTAPGSGATCDPSSLTACIGTNSSGMCDPVSKKCIMASGPTMVLGFKINGGSTNSPVVVLRDGSESMHLLDGKTGKVIASASWPPPASNSSDPSQDNNGICPAAMSAADLDGDGQPEIIVPSGDMLYTFKYTGGSTLKQLWSYPIDDYMGQCGASGSAAFDFNGVGKYDVVYHDTQYIYVLNGPDGSLIYQAPRSSDTIFETPVIADVDNDGHADLIMTNDENDQLMASNVAAGVKVLSNAGNNWPATRRVWSDHAYHESEITDGDTVPIVETPSWSTNNNWRAQNTLCKP